MSRTAFQFLFSVMLVGRLEGSQVERDLPDRAQPGVPFAVTILVRPDANVAVYALEEQVPSGFTPEQMSHLGQFDPLSGKIRWGPFFDGNDRTLSYQVTASSDAVGSRRFEGQGGFNGSAVPVEGDQDVIVLGKDASNFVTAVMPAQYQSSVSFPVELQVAPSPNTSFYAVEEQVPLGWSASQISEQGQWNEASHKIRWGPFTDNIARVLSYWVTPPASAVGEALFSGIGAFDEAAVPISGTRRLQPVVSSVIRQLPEKFQPGVAFAVELSINPAPEVSYYALEELLPSGWQGNDISSGGVRDQATGKIKWGPFEGSTARTLTYQAVPPMTITAEIRFAGIGSFDQIEVATTGAQTSAVIGSSIERALPSTYVPGAHTSVQLRVLPTAAVATYAVEERSPAGWRVSDINEGGHFDSLMQKIKWGPFHDHLARTLSYTVTPAENSAAAGHFEGIGVFDLTDVRVLGLAELPSASLESVNRVRRVIPTDLQAGGSAIVRYEIELAVNIKAWAVEEEIPVGWMIDQISNGGTFDTVRGRVKWGPFFSTDRTELSYRTQVPAGVVGVARFTGLASLDGLALAVGGPDELTLQPNQRPSLDPIPDQILDEGQVLSLALSASDPDVPPQNLTFSLDPDAPEGANLDVNNGLFTWSPSEAQGPGTYHIAVQVTANGPAALSAVGQFDIVVREVNQSPLLVPIGDRTVAPGTPISFPILTTDSDLPSQQLTFSLGADAPFGAALHPNSGAFTWTPGAEMAGRRFVLTVTATDNGLAPLSASQIFAITVAAQPPPPANTAPILAPISDKSARPGETLTFTVSATDAESPPQRLAFSLGAGAPAGAVLDSSSGLFTWTPGPETAGQRFDLTVTVTDDGSPALSVSQTFAITVAAQPPPPANTAPILAAISDKSARPGETLTFTVSATDAESPPQRLAFNLGAGAPVGATIDSNSDLFTWIPGPETAGLRFVMTITVTDDGSPALTASQTFVITVAALPPSPNTAPVLGSISDKLARPGDTLTFIANATDAESPPQRLTFSLGAGAPSDARIDPISGVFTWVVSATQSPGEVPLMILVADNGTPPLSASRTFRVQVPGPNTPPILAAIEDRTIEEGQTISFSVLAADRDVPKQKLSYTLDAGAPDGATLDPQTLTFSWTPTEAEGPGSYRLSIRVTDDGQLPLSDTRSFTITVTEVNSPPALAPMTGKTVSSGETLDFTAIATDPDLPAQTLIFALAEGPGGATIDARTGRFAWTPAANEPVGSVFALITVRDNGTPTASATQAVRIDVGTAPPTGPRIRLVEPPDGKSFVLPAAIRLVAVPQDFPALPRRIEFLANGVIIGEAPAAPFEFTWQNAAPGRYHLGARAITADDNAVLSQVVEIVVTAALRLLRPVVTSQNEIQLVLEGMPNKCYRVESTADFRRWAPLLIKSADATGHFVAAVRRDPAVSGSFYRVVKVECDAAQPVEISQPEITTTGLVRFNVLGAPNTCYTVEATSDFLTWKTISIQKTDTAGNSEIKTIMDRTLGSTFFRVRQTECEGL
ncbi:MAG: putative Ig domain-containing protein [Verrucomicrobiales bacterium]|nr:putative Ig domain-containing protein [Verrucomicrobiales bacterium]